MRRTLLLAFAALVVAGSASAEAFYGNGATIVSASLQRLEQGDDASAGAAISADGRYVVFQTQSRNLFPDGDADPSGQYRVGGVFRRDLDTGALELVADGDFRQESNDALLTRGASNPSVSASGRYVAFSTAQALVASDTNGAVDVYVRDMSRPLAAVRSSNGAYEIASARSGTDLPASYQRSGPSNPGTDRGSEITRAGAISSDGRKVVFRTQDVRSDLPAEAGTTTPDFQAFHRDLDSDTTTLVTRDKATQAPAGGAEGAVGLSPDGSTVVWAGRNAVAQARFVTGESADNGAFYYLWRRVADGPSAPTRRITGATDVDDPGCPPGSVVGSSPTATGPCYGPLGESESGSGISARLPGISSDGRTIAFIVQAAPRPILFTGVNQDLWLTDMSSGVSRKTGSIELTREGSQSGAQGDVTEVSMSHDGRWLAVASQRTRFSWPALTQVGATARSSGFTDLYVVDLASRTVELATRSVAGGDINGGIERPTISNGGDRAAFVSGATNLFRGDANSRDDAFAVQRTALPDASGAIEGLAEVEPPFQSFQQVDGPSLPVRVRRGKKGELLAQVTVPAAGKVEGTVKARLKKGRKRRLKTVSKDSGAASAAGRVTLVLKPDKSVKALLRKKKRMSASLRVVFTPRSKGSARITRTVRVSFTRAPARRR